MNREERRKLKKGMSKSLVKKAEKIKAWHKEYEGKDNDKAARLITEEIKTLSLDELLLLAGYLDEDLLPPT